MKIVQIDDKLSVSGQLTVSDVKHLANSGIKLLMCNRPDGEETGQPGFEEIEKAAIENQMSFVNIPCKGTNIPEHLLEEFVTVLDNSDNNNDKIHAYCRTGNRCSVFWGLSHVRTNSVEDTLKIANTLGFNFTPILEQLHRVRKKYS